MPDSVTTQPTAATSPGWKTTEMWLSLLGLFLLAWLCYALVGLLPEIVKALPVANNPMLASIIGLAVSGAVTGLGWVAHKVIAQYASVRLQLKLGDFLPLPPGDVQPSAGQLAASAGGAAAKDPAKTL